MAAAPRRPGGMKVGGGGGGGGGRGGREREAALLLVLIAAACGFVVVLLNLPDGRALPGAGGVPGAPLSLVESTTCSFPFILLRRPPALMNFAIPLGIWCSDSDSDSDSGVLLNLAACFFFCAVPAAN